MVQIFYMPDALLVTIQQCKITEGNSP